MRYIGPFFRMNSLSQKEINGQLFYLSKEAVKTIVLESKCGLTVPIKKYSKNSSSIDITTNSNFSPLLCVYRKASPTFIHSKNSNGFDEDTFKKEINPSTNALMTLCLLELLDYYRSFEDIDNTTYSIYELYKNLSKDQLEFYSINLRNDEGVFADKRNLLENNSRNFSLVDKDKKFKFSDQAFMMLAYYLYSEKNSNGETSKAYYNFSLEILKMLCEYKEKIYDCSLDEICKILLSLNIFYSHKNLDMLKELIIDLSDYAMNKFDEKDYYIDSLNVASLCALVLTLSYKHTKILTFLDKASEIINRLYTLYDEDKECFYKLSSKKEIKYSCFDITFYFLAFVVYGDVCDNSSEYKNMLSSIYKKFFINSKIISSWPDAPTLDDYERYRGLTLNSSDMIDESHFRMPNIPTPDSAGIAPVFNKSVTYNKRKDTFSSGKATFDSYKNFLNFFIFIHFFKDEYMNEVELSYDRCEHIPSISSIDKDSVTDVSTEEADNNIEIIQPEKNVIINKENIKKTVRISEENILTDDSSIVSDIPLNSTKGDKLILNNSKEDVSILSNVRESISVISPISSDNLSETSNTFDKKTVNKTVETNVSNHNKNKNKYTNNRKNKNKNTDTRKIETKPIADNKIENKCIDDKSKDNADDVIRSENKALDTKLSEGTIVDNFNKTIDNESRSIESSVYLETETSFNDLNTNNSDNISKDNNTTDEITTSVNKNTSISDIN